MRLDPALLVYYMSTNMHAHSSCSVLERLRYGPKSAIQLAIKPTLAELEEHRRIAESPTDYTLRLLR